MRLYEVAQTKLQPFDAEKLNTPNQMDMMRDPEYMAKKKGMVGEIVWMSPKEYIERSERGFKSIGEPGLVRQGRDPKLIKKYAQDMLKGDKFPMLELDYRGGFAQEGLHRAMAAEMIGVEKVPVFVTKESPEFADKRNAERRSEFDKIKAQASEWEKERQSSVVDDILGSFGENIKESDELQSGEHRWRVEYKDGSTEEVIAGTTAFSVRKKLSGIFPPPSAREMGIKKVHKISDPSRKPKGSFGFNNRGYTRDMRARNEVDDILGSFDESLTEGISPVVYHYTGGVTNALSILEQDRFKLTASPGTDTERNLQKGDRYYYLSTTRHKLGGYHVNPYRTGIIFNLDGTKLAQRYAGKPVDYWGPEWYQNKAQGGKGPEEKEAEDRIYSYKPFIPNASKYIRSIHVLLDPEGYKSQEEFGVYYRRLAILAKKRGIPLFIYSDKNDWLNQNTKKAVPPSKIDIIAGAKGKDRDQRQLYNFRRQYLAPWIELYMTPVGGKLSKKARDTRYNYVLYGYSDSAQSLAAEIHNAKSKPADETGLETLLKIFRKEKIRSPQEYIDLLKDKWTPKDESV